MLCEGPVQGIYDIIVEGDNLVCRDYVDVEARGNAGDSINCEGNMIEGSVLQGQKVENQRANFALQNDAANMSDVPVEDVNFSYTPVGPTIRVNIRGGPGGEAGFFIGSNSLGWRIHSKQQVD